MAAATLFERHGQRQLHLRTIRSAGFIYQVAVIMGRVAIVLGLKQKIGTGATLGLRAGDPELAQFRSRGICLGTVGHVEIHIAKGTCGFLFFSGRA